MGYESMMKGSATGMKAINTINTIKMRRTNADKIVICRGSLEGTWRQ